MRANRLFIVAAVLLIIGIGSLATGWHGNAGFNVGIPVSGTSVSIAGTATGAHALAGLIATPLGLILFLIAVIAALLEERRPVR
jgi:hypothetical protein